MKNGNAILKILRYILSIGLSIVFLVPILWMFSVSFKPEGSVAKTVQEWFLPPYTLENYIKVITGAGILKWTQNSIIIAAASTFIYLVIASLAAYAISAFDFRYKKFIYVFFMAGLMVPTEATIISLYITVKNMNLLNSYIGIILPTVAGPLGVIILKSFFDAIPRDLVDSASIDGCRKLTMYRIIFLPLAKSALTSVAIFTFIGSWNNFLWPFLSVMEEGMFTLPIGVPTLIRNNYASDSILPMTGNAVASIPIVITFLIFEKQIVKGIALTGIKA